MKIVDNFLSKEDFTNIIALVCNNFFPWYYQDHKVNPRDGFLQFTHTAYSNSQPHSNLYDQLTPLFKKINFKSLLRCKLNLSLKTDKIITSQFHTDYDFKCTTAIYYLNTNNGKTIFKKSKQEVKSVANRLVTFDSLLEHAGTSHTDTDTRLVLNLNYF